MSRGVHGYGQCTEHVIIAILMTGPVASSEKARLDGLFWGLLVVQLVAGGGGYTLKQVTKH